MLAVNSPIAPAAGQQVTTTVQVTPTALNDDDGDDQVNSAQVASAEIHGTVVSQDADTLRLTVTGFPATGLAILLRRRSRSSRRERRSRCAWPSAPIREPRCASS